MNRRDFLKSTLTAAVAATLPAIPATDPVHYAVAPASFELSAWQHAIMDGLVQGEIGRFEGITILA